MTVTNSDDRIQSFEFFCNYTNLAIKAFMVDITNRTNFIDVFAYFALIKRLYKFRCEVKLFTPAFNFWGICGSREHKTFVS